MPYNQVKWFSFPFVAPKGKGSKPKPAQGEIVEVDPPPGPPPRRGWINPLLMTPEKRRQRIVELLAIGIKRLEAKKKRGW